MVFEKKRRHLERYIEISRILTRHGWEYAMSRFGLADVFHLRRRHAGAPPQPVQVRQTLEELGPAFIKLGQMLSTRTDVMPPEYLAELEKLTDAAPPVTYSDILEVVEDEFGVPIAQLFQTFDEAPLASASIGQTHTATLADGSPVVVKVQRPGIRQRVENDVEIMSGVARFLEHRFDAARVLKLADLVEEFAITIRQELDYTREGRNGDLLREGLASCPFVRIAATDWEHTTPRVMTTERIYGVKITDLKGLDDKGYDRKAIASNLSQAYLKMVFENGFFQGDPHAGNLVVMDDCVIGVLDYGIVGRLHHDIRSQVTMLLANYVQEDSAGFAKVLLSMGTSPPDLDRRAFEQSIDRLLRQYYGAPVSELNMGEVLSRALRLSARMRVSLPPSLALLIKVILGVEGIDHILHPDYDLAAEAHPYIVRSFRGEFSVGELRDDFLESLMSWKTFLLNLPMRVSDVLDHMAEGSFRVTFKHEGLEGPTRDIDRSANRLSFALIASATIIASAQILSSQVGPKGSHGYPLLGIVGIALAFVFAVWLMISIVRSGRLW